MDDIYLGRIVAIARNEGGAVCALYRVSSRSFPNRRAVVAPEEDRVSIVPKEGHEGDVFKNPYIAYNCARVVRGTAVVTNGSQTDPIAEKIEAGMPVRDALVYALCALDYEKDKYNTPRIAAAVCRGDARGWLATVRADGLDVEAFDLEPGSCLHLATYEHDRSAGERRSSFGADSAEAGCDWVLGQGAFAHFTHPIASVCVMETADGFSMAARDV